MWYTVAMATCYHRKLAWLVPGQALSFKPVSGCECITVPCGKCIACRVNKSAEWAVRAMHDVGYVEQSCFVTSPTIKIIVHLTTI